MPFHFDDLLQKYLLWPWLDSQKSHRPLCVSIKQKMLRHNLWTNIKSVNELLKAANLFKLISWELIVLRFKMFLMFLNSCTSQFSPHPCPYDILVITQGPLCNICDLQNEQSTLRLNLKSQLLKAKFFHRAMRSKCAAIPSPGYARDQMNVSLVVFMTRNEIVIIAVSFDITASSDNSL